jgi:glutamate 5-kinase
MELGLDERPKPLAQVQALAAIGQSLLMTTYESLFRARGFRVAQLLLTHQDLDSRIRYRNAKNTLDELLRHDGVIPIVNENDSVAVEELKFGDNDELSAEVAILCQARRLVLLSTVDGLAENPDGSGEILRQVDDIAAVQHLAGDHKGRHSVGGMRSKLMAVQTAVEAGIETVIANGRTAGVLSRAVSRQPDQSEPGTLFLPGKPQDKPRDKPEQGVRKRGSKETSAVPAIGEVTPS